MWIGVDVLELGELDRLLERSWFREFAFADEELDIARTFSPSRHREFLAGRFAAKEAVLKALGTGIGEGVRPRHIAVLRADSGAPVVRLTGAAAVRAAHLGMGTVHVSIGHKRGIVVAVAMGLPEAGQSAAGGPPELGDG